MKGKQIVIADKPNHIQAGLVELGQMVRHCRTKNRLKIKDAADLLGMSVTTLIRIEKGDQGVSSGNLFKALQGFGIRLDIQQSESTL
ncbi:helix-turn-helix domain-containing protein [Thiomicrospira microaerophila]|uniref:helix-turn-helix domain-containing protein n=1 Tax=Thiomicrospira microaerophila TaxID=406020 RepID=UPI0006972693|nr:helix-turn-helix transcriptional regulator [Thiomicrospira microaerophila]